MAGRPAARVLDPVVHPLPPVLQPGPGSFNVIIGYKPAWRGVPSAAAAAIKTAKKASDAVLKTAKAATTLASGTPGAPAAKLAEETAKTAALAAMGNMISGMSGGADIHACLTPLPLPPHGPGVVVDGSPTVLINGLPACRQGDTIVEALGPPNKIAVGLFTVLIGNSANPAAPSVSNSFMDMLGDAVEAVGEAIEDAAEAVVDFLTPDVVTGLGEDVDKIINMSPSLKAKVAALLADEWKIEGNPGSDVECDKEGKVIHIDTNETTNEQVMSVAHEAGHAAYDADPETSMAGKTRDEYIAENLMSDLKDEGEATLTNIEARNEILENGGPDIGIAGNEDNHEAYQKSYDDFQDSDDRDKAREEIGTIFADGEEAGNTGKSYRDYYSEWWEDKYDDAHPTP